MAKSKKKKFREWNISYVHHSFWMKFYAEQCGYPNIQHPSRSDMIKLLIDCITDFKNSLPPDVSMDAYIHDKDSVEVKGSPFQVASEKPHAHLYVRFPERKKFSTFLNDLKKCKIDLRINEMSENLLRHVVEDGNGFPDERSIGQGEAYCVVYNCHADHTSKDIKGKVEYPWDSPQHITTYTEEQFNEFVRNQSLTNTRHFFKGISIDEQIFSSAEARQIGESGGDFQEWTDTLPPTYNLNQSVLNALLRSYNRGLDSFLSDPRNTDMTRLCLFIVGAPNIGKSGSLALTLSDLGYKTHHVSAGGGTGKMDDFHYWHDALILDDTVVSGLMNYCDDRIVRAYRRNSNNPLFRCKVVAITYNHDIDKYYKYFFNKSDNWNPDSDITFQAFKSRFVRLYIANDGRLVKIDQTLRGTPERVGEKLDMLEKILPIYTGYMQDYYKKKSLLPTGKPAEERLGDLLSLCNASI